MHKHCWLVPLNSFWLWSLRLSLFICLLCRAFRGNESLPPPLVSQRWAAWPPGAWLISHHYPISLPSVGSFLFVLVCIAIATCTPPAAYWRASRRGVGLRVGADWWRLMSLAILFPLFYLISKIGKKKKLNQSYCICSMADSSPAG